MASARTTLWAAALLAGCGAGPTPEQDASEASEFEQWLGFEPPATARVEVALAMWTDARTPRHPDDGGGSWSLVEEPDGPTAVRGPVRLGFEFVAGPGGVAEGGALYLQAPPFWGWSTPQTDDPAGLGYTTVRTDAEGVELEARTVDQQLLEVRVGGRGLAAGEKVRITYGDGPARARADRYAETAARFHLAVDADGDGVRELIDHACSIAVGPGPPARLLAHLPATARPGEVARLSVALVDVSGNRSPWQGEPLELDVLDESGARLGELRMESGVDHASMSVAAGDGGTRRLNVRPRSASLPAGLSADSNPMRVSTARHVLWADLQSHSSLSDGTGEPEALFSYAREIAALDVFALTDHDHWGLEPLDENPRLWQRILDAADAADRPGTFLALAGFEWTSWLFGHRHVVHFGEQRPLLSSLDRSTDEPWELWAALEGLDSISIPHTLAGGPLPVDWTRSPDPLVEPVVELVSVHGASDGPDSPRPIYAPHAGHWFGDVLQRGHRYGVLGSTDGHDGHPGLAHLAAPTGGLAGILAESPTREAVLAAIRDRACFATSGPRILIRTNLAGRPMGAGIPRSALGDDASLFVEVFAAAPLRYVDLMGSSGALARVELEGQLELRTMIDLPELESEDTLWVRAVQQDGHAAWTSPYFLD